MKKLLAFMTVAMLASASAVACDCKDHKCSKDGKECKCKECHAKKADDKKAAVKAEPAKAEAVKK